MKNFAVACMLLLGAVSTAFCAQITDERPIRIGLIHFSAPLSKDMDFSPTLTHLKKTFAPRSVEAKVYSSADLEDAIKAGNIDFFYASSGFFWRMLPYGVRDIATVVTHEKPDPNRGTAGTFITLRDRSDIVYLKDMKGKRFVANYPSAFHGYRIGMAELEARDINHEKFFSDVHFLGENAEKIIDELIKGKADVGFLRACWLEEFEHHNIAVLDKIKVIEPVPGAIACLHSTRAYPNNTFSSTFAADKDLAKAMSVALLTMQPTETGQSWSLATDFKAVDKLYKSLKTGPYEHLRHWTVKRVLKEYWPFFVIAVLSLLGLILHSWRSDRLVERRSRELTEANQKVRKFEDRMESMQKSNLVGQLSSIFAHEMNQPLGACSCYVDGLKTLNDSDGVDRETLSYSLDQLQKEIDRATGIVNKVRSYAKTRTSRDKSVNLSSICNEVLESFRTRYGSRVKLSGDPTENIFVIGDPLELHILVYNLVKNAVEAASEVPDAAVGLTLEATDSSAILEVSNSGKVLSDEEVASIGNPMFMSRKENGLGLGSSVVFSIVEAMGGKIEKQRGSTCGLLIRVSLPIWK